MVGLYGLFILGSDLNFNDFSSLREVHGTLSAWNGRMVGLFGLFILGSDLNFNFPDATKKTIPNSMREMPEKAEIRYGP